MNDRYIRALCTNGGIRAIACSTTELSRRVCRLQQSSPTVSVALGRGLAAGALMGALLKPGQRVALKFEGNGPMGKMIIEADSDGAVRGCAGTPAAEAEPVEGRWNVAGVLGRAGFLTVTRDLGLGGEPYRGMVQLCSSEIGDDLAYYLTDSEQTPSAVGLGVQLDSSGEIEAAGGFLVQTLPGADEGELERILERLGQMPPLSGLLRRGGADLLLKELFEGIPYTLLEERELEFRCSCSRQRVEQALLSLGADELREMRETDRGAEVSCEFCRQGYRFSGEELSGLADQLTAGREPCEPSC